MKITDLNTVEEFALYFLKGRMLWRDVPRLESIRNFGSIISMLLYRKPPFQVELLIVPHQQSSFTTHRHPDVDSVEYGLCGDHVFILNGEPGYTQEQMNSWLSGNYNTPLIHILPTDWHSGYNNSPYAFLSIQKWLHNVQPTSVGLNWEGELVSEEHKEIMAKAIPTDNLDDKLQAMLPYVQYHMTV